MILGIIIGIIIMSVFALIGFASYENGGILLPVLCFGPFMWILFLICLIIRIFNNKMLDKLK